MIGDQVVLWESGLPGGHPVVGDGARVLDRVEHDDPLGLRARRDGTGSRCSPIPGYRILPANGGFTVTDVVQLVEVQFVLIRPPPPAFPVTFRITGLPASTLLGVTVRGVTQNIRVTDLDTRSSSSS